MPLKDVASLFEKAPPFESVFREVKENVGIYHNKASNDIDIGLLQMFIERGHASSHMYQPSVENRPSNWPSLMKRSGKDRPLVDVCLNPCSDENIVSPMAYFGFEVTPEGNKGVSYRETLHRLVSIGISKNEEPLTEA